MAGRRAIFLDFVFIRMYNRRYSTRQDIHSLLLRGDTVCIFTRNFVFMWVTHREVSGKSEAKQVAEQKKTRHARHYGCIRLQGTYAYAWLDDDGGMLSALSAPWLLPSVGHCSAGDGRSG